MEIFSELAIVLFFAALGGVFAKLLKQQAILGYLLAGALMSWWGLVNGENVRILGQIGVTLLLFLVGLELPLSQLKKLGSTAVVTGLGQISVTMGLGILISRGLGFGFGESVYLGLALTFSSTIVVVKLLSEKGDLNSLHGKIAVGSLLVQDFVAIGVLMALSGVGGGVTVSLWGVVWLIAKAVGLLTATFLLSSLVMPKIISWLAGSVELLFVFSLGWCLFVAAWIASPEIGFSVEIGGLLAGLAFANASQHGQIMARVKPLRDFFLTLFFVALGAGVNLSMSWGVVVPSVILAVYVLVGNPLIMMNLLGLMGYKKRTAFLAGITMGQISEFSLIVISAAVLSKQISSNILTVVTFVGIVTMTVSTYVIQNGSKAFRKYGKYLPFVRKGKGVEIDTNNPKYKVALFGYGRTGKVLLPVLNEFGATVVVDFDPHVVEMGSKLGLGEIVYGDISDVELYDQLGLKDVEVIVSTVPDFADSTQLLDEVRSWGRKPVVVVTAVDETDARKLYRMGADYVLIPNQVGGEYLAGLLGKHDFDRKELVKHGTKHKEELGA